MDVGDEYVVMRVTTDIDEMTYGVGNTFSLRRGKQYRVPGVVFRWLAEKGLAERVQVRA